MIFRARKSDAKSNDEKPKGTDDFQKDLQYLMLMMAFEDAFGKLWVELLIRCKFDIDEVFFLFLSSR